MCIEQCNLGRETPLFPWTSAPAKVRLALAKNIFILLAITQAIRVIIFMSQIDLIYMSRFVSAMEKNSNELVYIYRLTYQLSISDATMHRLQFLIGLQWKWGSVERL